MVEKPSDIHGKKLNKMTRRRMLKLLSGAGMSAATLRSLSVDDVAAADSDQMTIPLDVEGKSKVRVSSDWYDRMVHARGVHRKVRDKWMNHDDVVGVWIHAGDKGGENPNITVEIDQESESKDETKGEIPGRKDGVKVNVAEQKHSELVACDDYDDSNPGYWVPGGLEASAIVVRNDQVVENKGTLTPHTVDNDFTYGGCWMTAYHVVCRRLYDRIACNGAYIGDVVYVDRNKDIAIIRPVDNHEPLDQVTEASNQDGRQHEIQGTLGRDGVEYWDNNNRWLFKYGYGSCYSNGKVKGIGTTEATGGHPCLPPQLDNQIQWGDYGDTVDGDSGGITFGADPNSDEYIACNMINGHNYGWDPISYSWGTAGYHLKDTIEVWWGDAGDD